MNKDLTLVIMAAGMGSRFGGLKQIEPVGPNGEIILEYSIYDALKAGVTKVVFIIKEENYDLFRETVGKKIEDKIEVVYAFQDIKDVPEGFSYPTDRTKPWGTGHAALSARKYVDGNFILINADDFYGRDAYMKVRDFFHETADPNYYATVSYHVINTMTENGTVKRGVCESKGKSLTKLVESVIEKKDDKIIATPLDGRDSFLITPETLVSVNFFGFSNQFFIALEENFKKFLERNKGDLEKCEYLITDDAVFAEVEDGKEVIVLESSDRWLGITYKEDKEYIMEEIKKLIDKGVYPYDLWK